MHHEFKPSHFKRKIDRSKYTISQRSDLRQDRKKKANKSYEHKLKPGFGKKLNYPDQVAIQLHSEAKFKSSVNSSVERAEENVEVEGDPNESREMKQINTSESFQAGRKRTISAHKTIHKPQSLVGSLYEKVKGFIRSSDAQVVSPSPD